MTASFGPAPTENSHPAPTSDDTGPAGRTTRPQKRRTKKTEPPAAIRNGGEAAVAAWREFLTADLPNRTVCLRAIRRFFCSPQVQGLHLTKIREEHIRDYFAHVKRAASTKRQHIIALRRFFDTLVGRKIIKRNPVPADDGDSSPESGEETSDSKTQLTGKPISLVWWANSYVVIAAILSAFLNGYANSLDAPIKIAAWAMGAVIPIFVLILFKVSAHLFKQGSMSMAFVPATVGTALLFLSLWDCQVSIKLLTHSPEPWLSWAFAIGIDCGLVACEVAKLFKD